MAYLTRKESEEFYFAAVKAIKELRVLSVGANFHVDRTPANVTGSFRDPTAVDLTVAAANGSDLATCLTLANQIDFVYRAHIGDDCCHKVASTVVPANAVPTDLTTLVAYVNDIKAKFNTHIASTTFHYTADATNTIATANATDLATSITLINVIKTNLNAHMASSPTGNGVKLMAS